MRGKRNFQPKLYQLHFLVINDFLAQVLGRTGCNTLFPNWRKHMVMIPSEREDPRLSTVIVPSPNNKVSYKERMGECIDKAIHELIEQKLENNWNGPIKLIDDQFKKLHKAL